MQTDHGFMTCRKPLNEGTGFSREVKPPLYAILLTSSPSLSVLTHHTYTHTTGGGGEGEREILREHTGNEGIKEETRNYISRRCALAEGGFPPSNLCDISTIE